MKVHRIAAAAFGLLLALALAATPALAAAGGTAPAPGAQPGTQTVPAVAAPVVPAPASGSPFDGNAMWIWQLPRTERGNLAAIAARAKANNVRALYIKSADGPRNDWRQFTPEMVGYFHSQGLKVCGWHYVYGTLPTAESRLSANAIRDGADCLVIDAEAEYEGKYAAADVYMRKLRAAVGPSVPIALAGFPYVDYHPSFPYSVFMRPQDGAQYNLPQMYWKAIGTSVDAVFRHTYRWNLPYGRPIFPLGQIWENPIRSEIKRFRQLATAYGATGYSWWEWSQGGASTFRATGKPISTSASPRQAAPVTVGRGSRGDWVVWAQEHLNGAGQAVSVTGLFGAQTQKAVTAFQAARALPATGQIDPATWQALLRVTPASTAWSRKASRARTASAARAGAATGAAPASASLPDRRGELAGRRR
jgi:hypothetical protein